jgi:hypothetical protein
MPWRLLIPLGGACWLFCVGGAWAKPQHKESLGRYYGSLLDANLKRCHTCHIVPEGVTEATLADSGAEHNAFGKRLSELGEKLIGNRAPELAARLKAVADEDADGDGVANEIELLAGTTPGDASQKPTAEQLTSAIDHQREFRAQYRWEPWQPVSRPEVPRVADADWVHSPIDAFIAAEHARHNLTPRPAAPPHVWLRRVYLDLIGLPPTADELQAFLDDASPEAYERVVDRLLKSPQYGERWGRHWMDVWRYSDWAGWGAQVRDSQPHVWRWRDWIIESLNADKPYDRMIAEMLAADELFPEDADALRGTGFLVRNYKRLSREQWMQDTVNHTAKAFLGLTFDCARCHDHMYDPISQDEYYRFRAIFEPYNVRTDRVPGQTNVEKDGLPRIFDAEPTVATYFFHRGDERQPDKERALPPGVPGALGGSPFAVQEVALPLFSHTPDKRPFVIEDDLSAAAAAIDAARKKAEAARQNAAKFEPTSFEGAADAEATRSAVEPIDRAVKSAELELAITEAKRASSQAVLRVEGLEGLGAKQNDPPVWEQAAREAAVAQRYEALLESRKAKTAAEEAYAKAHAAQRTSESKLAGNPDDARLKGDVDKAAKAAQDASKKLVAAIESLHKAEQEAAAAPTTAYKPRALTTYPQTSTGRRSALARWLGDAQNPLTARVAVNQIWMRHFGQPLVPTVFDFGNNGQPATHPALLDWLAAEFMQPSAKTSEVSEDFGSLQPWSMKHLHRLIVTSQTYRMASTFDDASAAVDPDNRWLWRMPPRRMEAEVVRDCVLYVAGRLDLTRGGVDLDYNDGLKIPRRSLYFRHAPEKQMTFLRLFDAASPNECYRRKESIIPQQALALANSSLSLEQARRVARTLHARHGEAESFIRAAFAQVLCRSVTDDELVTCTAFLTEQQAFLEQNTARLTASASKTDDVGKPSADRALRARENLVHVLFNHHDFVTVH